VKVVVFNDASLGMVEPEMLVGGFADFGTDHPEVGISAVAPDDPYLSGQRSLLDPDRQRRADHSGVLHVRRPLRRRFGVEQDHDPVLVALVEHVGGGHHALAGGDALVLVDGHLHGVLLGVVGHHVTGSS
jgi:hypothetical protein